MLNRQTMSIPAEAALDMEALHGPVSRDDVLDGRGKQVAVVRQAGREWRTIVENIVGPALGQLDLTFKRLNLAPSLDDGLLFLGEVDRHGDS